MKEVSKLDLIGNWECPYCKRFATLREEDIFRQAGDFVSSDANHSYTFTAITCLNSACQKLNAMITIKDMTPLPPPVHISRTSISVPVNHHRAEKKHEKIDIIGTNLSDRLIFLVQYDSQEILIE